MIFSIRYLYEVPGVLNVSTVPGAIRGFCELNTRTVICKIFGQVSGKERDRREMGAVKEKTREVFHADLVFVNFQLGQRRDPVHLGRGVGQELDGHHVGHVGHSSRSWGGFGRDYKTCTRLRRKKESCYPKACKNIKMKTQ